MNLRIQASPCDPDRLESFLRGDLSEVEQRELSLHLNGCEDCRRVLEQHAAEPEAWREAEELLRPLEFGSPGDEEWSGVQTQHHRQPLLIQNVIDALGPTDDPAMLGRLGGYEVSGVVGAGGMGVVLKAVDKSLDRSVAIKVLAPHLATSGAARKRFGREAKAAAAVLHPNVIAIHSVSNDEALPYLVMPYMRGASLQKRLDAEGPLSLSEILRIGSQVAAGLAAAHAQGLVHRDIKPANILLEEGTERVTITDFGLARAIDDATITHTGAIAGTPQYMSPEQARGEPVDQRSDLFSLGSVLYALCTGRAPFRAETSYGVLRRITDDDPRPIREIIPDIPEWLCGIISRLMAKQPADRIQSAGEAAELLEQCLAHVQQPTVVPLPSAAALPHQPDRASGRFGQTGASARRLIAGGLVALAALFAGVVVVLELNKGTLTIESDSDDVALKITQGDEVVEKLTVTRGSNNVRIAAGKYRVEIDGKADGITVENGTVTIQRRGSEIVRVVSAPDPLRQSSPSSGETRLWNEFGVTPAPVSAVTAKVLEWIGLHLSPISKEQFREKNVFAQYTGGLDVTFVRTHGPAEKAGIHEVDIVVNLQNKSIASLDDLDGAMHHAVELIERGYSESLEFDVLHGGKTVRINIPLPVRELGLGHNDKRIAKDVAKQIEELKIKFPQLQNFSATEHLKENKERSGFAPGSVNNPQLYTIHYQNGVLARTRREPDAQKYRYSSEELTFDQKTGVYLDVYFLKNYSHPISDDPIYRIGDVSVALKVMGPAAEQIRGEILAILKEVGAGSSEKGPGGASQDAGQSSGSSNPASEVNGQELQFSEAKELVLSMDSSQFMLDLDTGKTMDPPATIRPEQGKMDLSTTQVQPYHYPTGLIGYSLQGVEVKASDWDASVADVRRALAGNIYALKEMDVGPEKTPTYFFKTRDGTDGVLQLLAVVDNPKGIRLRYKTVKATTETITSQPQPPATKRDFSVDTAVNAVAVSADGKLIAIANGNPTLIAHANGTSRVKGDWKSTVEVLDAETGAHRASLQLLTAEEQVALAATPRISLVEATSLAFSSDGSLLAVSTNIGQLKLFNTATGEVSQVFDDRSARLGDKETPESWKPIARAMGSVRSLAFSPDGSLLAACGETFAEFSDVFDGIERRRLPVTGPGRLKVWDVKTGALKYDLAGHSQAFGVAFSADGSMLASAGRWDGGLNHDNGVIVWNPASGEKLRTLVINANGGTHSIAFAPNKKLLVAASRVFDKENDTSKTLITLAYPASGITEWQQSVPGWAKPAFALDGNTLAVLSSEKKVRFLDAATGSVKHELALDRPQVLRWNDFAVATKAHLLAVGGKDKDEKGVVEVWDLKGALAPHDSVRPKEHENQRSELEPG